MAKVHRLYVGIVIALTLCKYCLAEWNATDAPPTGTVSDCHLHGNRDNCTEDTVDTGQSNGHFSKCPEELEYYCIHGECRYIKDQDAPSCRCQIGYIGSRCEYLNLEVQIQGKQRIIITCAIAGLVLLILLVVFICICSRRRRRLQRDRQREEPRNGTEKLGMMMDSNATGSTLKPDSAEQALTNSV
ncbi:probetacellulin [Pundamilia nyererei]|uniref:Probetacellulin-like n=2 Tax=Haplochromini TaxID=319058 RepID=A0A3B4FGL8_9CICH|nr:probetacellulin isoform X1 [Maylandia zebra]XP_005720373.1 PREDICTED: probetacellulin-like [Pundamilia nyererei]XP_026029298.1 probetacellulin-like isoform X1 [Astatotilapia calliptera]